MNDRVYVVYGYDYDIMGIISGRLYRNKEEVMDDLYKNSYFGLGEVYDVEEFNFFHTAKSFIEKIK